MGLCQLLQLGNIVEHSQIFFGIHPLIVLQGFHKPCAAQLLCVQ